MTRSVTLSPASVQPIKIAILAMGGEGGGVLADWIVDLAEHNGHIAQTTSVPGVAQRTGATIYYVECFPTAQAERDGGRPVLALMPLPGDVDVVLASELMEAARAVQRGLVTPDRTTLIASTHRVYAIAEKIAMGDGRLSSEQMAAHARAAAQRYVAFDMARAAEDAGSVISAVLFGALAGTGVLPFTRAQFEATIERGGVGIKPSLKAFGQAVERVSRPAETGRTDAGQMDAGRVDGSPADAGPGVGGATQAESPTAERGDRPPRADSATVASLPLASDPSVQALLQRVASQFPAEVQGTLVHGLRRLVDYQDVAYAELYLDRLQPIAVLPSAGQPLLDETARHLALWMSYEDTIRVAELKTRATRFERVQGEVRVGADQVLGIDEYMHPRLEEICDTLPAGLGRWLLASGWPRRLIERFTRQGRVVTTTSLRGFVLLYGLAGLKRWRRSSLRYLNETPRIEAWLAQISRTATSDPLLAVELARCQALVKGYGDTHARGTRNFETLMAVVQRRGASLPPATLGELRSAALADEHGHALIAALARHALA